MNGDALRSSQKYVYYPTNVSKIIRGCHSRSALFNRCARCTSGCTKICVACTTKKGFTKVHHNLSH